MFYSSIFLQKLSFFPEWALLVSSDHLVSVIILFVLSSWKPLNFPTSILNLLLLLVVYCPIYIYSKSLLVLSPQSFSLAVFIIFPNVWIFFVNLSSIIHSRCPWKLTSIYFWAHPLFRPGIIRFFSRPQDPLSVFVIDLTQCFSFVTSSFTMYRQLSLHKFLTFIKALSSCSVLVLFTTFSLLIFYIFAQIFGAVCSLNTVI